MTNFRQWLRILFKQYIKCCESTHWLSVWQKDWKFCLQYTCPCFRSLLFISLTSHDKILSVSGGETSYSFFLEAWNYVFSFFLLLFIKIIFLKYSEACIKKNTRLLMCAPNINCILLFSYLDNFKEKVLAVQSCIVFQKTSRHVFKVFVRRMFSRQMKNNFINGD